MRERLPAKSRTGHEIPVFFRSITRASFPLVAAVEHLAAAQLKATGTITPDIPGMFRSISVATGRVVEIAARLGDTVKKGQLLLRGPKART